MKIKTKDIVLNTFCMYLILKPLYLLKDSPFQLADIILVVSFLFLIISKKNENNDDEKNTNIKTLIIPYLSILLYQLIINIITYINVDGQTLESISLLKNNIYYLFNFIVIIYVYLLYFKFGKEIFNYYTKGIYISVFIILLGLVININKSTRNSSFFLNPNQLGYYILTIMTSLILLKDSFSSKQKIIIFFISILSLIMCGSRAAIFGFGIDVILILIKYITKRKKISKKINKKYLIITIILIVAIIMVWPLIKEPFNTYKTAFLTRYNQKSNENTDLGDTRGYNRIFELDNNLLYGSGEGAFYRFTIMNGNETHSSFATIIVSYGLIGTLLYLLMLLKINNHKLKNIIYFIYLFSGIMFYWLSHNGLRSSIFWIIIVIFNIQIQIQKNKN